MDDCSNIDYILDQHVREKKGSKPIITEWIQLGVEAPVIREIVFKVWIKQKLFPSLKIGILCISKSYAKTQLLWHFRWNENGSFPFAGSWWPQILVIFRRFSCKPISSFCWGGDPNEPDFIPLIITFQNGEPSNRYCTRVSLLLSVNSTGRSSWV